MLADDFGAPGYLLEKDLHHIHLADGEPVHLCHILGDLLAMLGWLEFLQISNRSVREVDGLSSGQDFAHLARVETEHRVLSELKALVDLTGGDLRGGAAEDAAVVLVGAVNCGDKRVVRVVVGHRSKRRGILNHDRIIVGRRGVW